MAAAAKYELDLNQNCDLCSNFGERSPWVLSMEGDPAMTGLRELRSALLHDEKITCDEVDAIRDYIRRDGKLDLDDVKVLVELLASAKEVCSEFDELFFPALKDVLLADGQIGSDEQFYLLKMLYSDGHVRDSERQFLAQLQREVTQPTPEFTALCKTAVEAKSRNWDLGGCRR